MDAPIAGPSAGVVDRAPPRGDLIDDIKQFYPNGDGTITVILSDGRQRVLRNPASGADEEHGPPLLPVEGVEPEPEKRSRRKPNSSGGLTGESGARNKDDQGGQDA